MVSAKEQFRHAKIPIDSGACIDRAIEQSTAERLIFGRIRATKSVRNQPGYGIYHYYGGELSTRQNIISNRDFVRYKILGDALIDPLIAAADQQEVFQLAQPHGHLLIEQFALRSQQSHRPGGSRVFAGQEFYAPE